MLPPVASRSLASTDPVRALTARPVIIGPIVDRRSTACTGCPVRREHRFQPRLRHLRCAVGSTVRKQTGLPGDRQTSNVIELPIPNTGLSLDGGTKPGQSIGQQCVQGWEWSGSPASAPAVSGVLCVADLRNTPSCGTVGLCAGCILPTRPLLAAHHTWTTPEPLRAQ